MQDDAIARAKSEPRKRWPAWLRPLGRFVGWWFSFFALLGPLSTCPVCGQPGCAGGIAGAGILGGIIAGVMWLPRQVVRAFRRRDAINGKGAE